MQRPGWFPDELAYAGEEHLDPGYVTTYDRKSAHDHTDDLAVLRSMGLNEESVVLDLGAGTGSFALAVAPAAAGSSPSTSRPRCSPTCAPRPESRASTTWRSSTAAS